MGNLTQRMAVIGARTIISKKSGVEWCIVHAYDPEAVVTELSSGFGTEPVQLFLPGSVSSSFPKAAIYMIEYKIGTFNGQARLEAIGGEYLEELPGRVLAPGAEPALLRRPSNA